MNLYDSMHMRYLRQANSDSGLPGVRGRGEGKELLFNSTEFLPVRLAFTVLRQAGIALIILLPLPSKC